MSQNGVLQMGPQDPQAQGDQPQVAPQQPQQPQGPPPGAQERLYRMFKARADALQQPALYDDGTVAIPPMKRQDAERAAVDGLRGYLMAFPGYQPDQDRAQQVRDYLSGQRKELPDQWLPDPTPHKSRATIVREAWQERAYAGQKAAGFFGRFPYDYIIRPLAAVYQGALQPAVTGVSSGINAVFGTNWHPEALAGSRALLYKASHLLSGGPQLSLSDAYARWQGIERGAAQAGSFGSGLESSVGEFVGGAAGMSPLFRGLKGVSGMVQGALRLAGYNALTAQGEGGKAPTAGERAISGAFGAATGLALPLFQTLGRNMASGILKKGIAALGPEEKQVVDAMQKWATENKVFPNAHEAQETYLKRLQEKWVDAGMPGGGMPIRKLIALGTQGTVESIPLAALDPQFHRDLLDAFQHGDMDAFKDAAMRTAASAIGGAALHLPLSSIVPWQRRQVTPTGTQPEPPPEPSPPGITNPAQLLPQHAEGFGEKAHAEFSQQQEEGGAETDVLKLAQAADARRAAEAQEPGRQARLDAERKQQEAARTKDLTQYPQSGEPGSGLLQLGRYGFQPESQGAAQPVPGQEPLAPAEDQPKVVGPNQSQRYSIPNSPYFFDVMGDRVRLSPELQKVTGSPEEMTKDAAVGMIRHLRQTDGLLAKQLFTGQHIDAYRHIYAEPGVGEEDGVMRTMQFGQPMQSPLGPVENWQPIDSAPARGKDHIDEAQEQGRDAVKGIINQRTDLPDHSLKTLGLVADVLDTVGAKNDQSVAETLRELPKVLGVLRDAPPPQAEQIVSALGDMLTNSTPEVADHELGVQRVESQARQVQHEKSSEQAAAPSQVGPESGRGAEPALSPAVERTPEGNVVVRDKNNPKKVRVMTEEQFRKQFPDEALGGIPVPKAVREVGTTLTKAGFSGIGKALKLYQQENMERLAAEVGGEPGKKLLDAARKVNDATLTNEARHSDEGGGYDILRQKTEPGLLRKVSDAYGGQTTVIRAVVDEPVGEAHGVHMSDLQGKEREQAEALRNFVKTPVKIAQELGLLGMEGFGEGGRRIPYYAVPDFAQQVRERSGPKWEAYLNYMKASRDKDPSQAQRMFTEARGAILRDPVEMTRENQGMPSWVPAADGKGHVQLFEDDPNRIVKIMRDRSSARLGARSIIRGPEFEYQEGESRPEPGQGYINKLPEPVPGQKILDEILNTRGQKSADAAAKMLRMMHGQPTDESGSFFEPGSEGSQAMQIADAGLGVLKSAHLIKAATQHLFQSFGNSYELGPANVQRSYAEVLGALATGKLPELHRDLVGAELLRDDKRTNELAATTDIEEIRQGMKTAADILGTPLHLSLSLNKLVDAVAARNQLVAMREGNAGRGAQIMLRRMGFSREDAQRIATGGGTEAEYTRYKHNAVGQLDAAGQLLASQKSAAETNRWWNRLVWFQHLFQARSRMLASLANDVKTAPTATEKAKAVGDFMGVLGFKAASATMGKTLSLLLAGGALDWLRESLASPKAAMKTMGGLMLHSYGGSVGSAMASSAKELWNADSPGAFERFSSALTSTFASPVSEAFHFAQMLANLRTQRMEAVSNYIQQVLPIAKDATHGLFGISALALSKHNPEVDSAIASAHRWLKDNKPPEPGNITNADFHAAIQQVMDRVKSGKLSGDPQIMQGVRAAVQAKMNEARAAHEPLTVDKALQDVAQSIRNQKMLPSQGAMSWSKADRDAYHAHLGDQHWRTLQHYDAVLDFMARQISGSEK